MCSEKGYTFIWIMFAVALASIALAGAGLVWKTEARREKEKELLFIGEQFRLAIGSYYEKSPGAKRYPDSIEKLLSDNRFPTATRHLRKIFYDPMTGVAEWGVISRPGVGVIGVHSLSTQKPLKKANFHERYASFSGAESYREWKFIYLPGEAGPDGSQPQPQAQPQPEGQPQPQGQRQGQPQPQPQPDSDPDAPTQAQPDPSLRPLRERDSSPFSGSRSPSDESGSFFRR
jgi:type II secretory pathway pseudopilin PulG